MARKECNNAVKARGSTQGKGDETGFFRRGQHKSLPRRGNSAPEEEQQKEKIAEEQMQDWRQPHNQLDRGGFLPTQT